MKYITTIVIEKDLRDKLLKMGKKGDSYNDIVRELLKKYRG